MSALIDFLTGTRDPGDGLPDVPPDAPRGRAAEKLLAAELVQELRIVAQTMGQYAEWAQGRLTNHVLATETVLFDTTGFVTRQFKVPVATLVIRNLSAANAITVTQAGGSQGAAPPTGRGVIIVPATLKESIAVGDTEFTVYGTAADRFCYQAFSVGPEPGIV